MINNKSEQTTLPDDLIFLIARLDQILPNSRWVPLFLRSAKMWINQLLEGSMGPGPGYVLQILFSEKSQNC